MAGFRLTERAKQDIRSITRYSQENWGARQARYYLRLIRLALEKLGDAPGIGWPRGDLADGLRSFKAANHIAYYVEEDGGIVVIRVLHPSMDLEGRF